MTIFNNEVRDYFRFLNVSIDCEESASGLQWSLNVFANYCDLWKLNVNKAETKVLIFFPMSKVQA